MIYSEDPARENSFTMTFQVPVHIPVTISI